MAELPTSELDALRSVVADLKDALVELTDATKNASGETKKKKPESKDVQATSTLSGAFGKLTNSIFSTISAAYSLAKTFASIAESGRQFAEKTGATASRGAQFQIDMNKILLSDIRKFGADQQLVAEQIKGAATSFSDVFVGAAAGMQISAQGSADFARSLSTGFKSEFTLTAQSMRALVTVGAATTKEFDAFRKASGRAGLSSGQFANLVNKNSLSFMLYGPSFARAAVSAERLGINLASVQKAQESMVTNLDGTIDTIAQLNQLGANIDFGSLVTMAETQGPEATLKYLQSTIPPSLFQSASTRALISKLGIPLEDLLKRQGSKQESAADRIEQAFSEVAKPASAAAESLSKLNKALKALEEAKIMEILMGFKSLGMAIIGLVASIFGVMKVFGLKSPEIGKIFTNFGLTFKNMAAKLLSPFNFIVNRLTALISKIPILGNVALKTPKAMISPFMKAGGGGALAGILGAVSGFMGAKKEGKDTATAAGEGYVRGASAAIFTALGAFGGPIGMIIGGFLGDVIGQAINKYIPELGEGIGIAFKKVLVFFEPVKTAFLSIGDTFKPLMDAVGQLFTVFDGPGRKSVASAAQIIGDALAFLLKIGLTPLMVGLQVLAGTIKFVINTITLVINLITGILSVLTFDFDKIKDAWSKLAESGVNLVGTLFKDLFNALASIVTGFFGDVGTTFISAVMKKLSNVPVVGRFFKEEETTKTGDDVVSRAGYGDRTLVTPNGNIALNNRDTVVAYADDMISGIKTYSLGTLSKQMSGGNGDLARKVDQLISVLTDAKTTIQVGDSTQQVPRMSVARVGAYERFGRPQ
jgi:hypothetical protein